MKKTVSLLAALALVVGLCLLLTHIPASNANLIRAARKAARSDTRPEQSAVYHKDLLKDDEPLRVLLVGNSFSVDTAEYLYDVAQACGTSFEVGCLYVNGTSLADHWANAAADHAAYHFQLNTSGQWQYSPTAFTMADGLRSADWDVVFFQQYSTDCGRPESYYDEDGLSYVTLLGEYTRLVCANDDIEVAWEMTWALPEDSNLSSFASYFNSSQAEMFDGICQTVHSVVARGTYAHGNLIAATGTAIQNARSSYLGDTLNRDERHLSYDLGRYLAAMSVASACGADLNEMTAISTVNNSSSLHLPLLRRCVRDAERTPYAVTPQRTDLPEMKEPRLTITTEGNRCSLSWDSVKKATGYAVRYSYAGQSTDIERRLSADTLSCDLTLLKDKTCFIRIAALGDEYIESTVSKRATVYVSDGPVLSAETDGTRCTMTWTPAVEAASYRIQYDYPDIGLNQKREVSADTLSWQLNLLKDRPCTLRVMALDENGRTLYKSRKVTVLVSDAPILSVKMEENHASLSWTPAAEAAAYVVSHRYDDHAALFEKTFTAEDRSYELYLLPDHSCTFTVSAVDEEGNVLYQSQPVTVEPEA